MVVLRALRKAVRRVCAAYPWYVENTMHAAYGLLCMWVQACNTLLRWLQTNAVWDGDLYTDKVLPQEFRPEGYEATWCNDAALLGHIEHAFLPSYP